MNSHIFLKDQVSWKILGNTPRNQREELICSIKLLSDILRRNDIEVKGFDHAVKERFRSKRVLIVVDDIHQLDSAAIDLHCFGRGSRIIITTRNMHLLRQLRIGRKLFTKGT